VACASISPVSPLARRVVSVSSQISNLTFIGILFPPQPVLLERFIKNAENS